jgi:phospholipase/carboxylesterase
VTLLALASACGDERAPRPATPPPPAAWGGLETRVIGDGDGPVIVWLQGYGAPAYDLEPLARGVAVPDGTRSVVPAAPLEALSGRAWWPSGALLARVRTGADGTRDLSGEVPDGLAAARRAVIALVEDAQRRLGVERSEIVIAGFSQGAMLAVDVGLHLDAPPAGVIALSGALLAEQVWLPRMRARPNLRVFVSHGRADPIIPFGNGVRLRDALERAGASTTWIAFEGGHTIPPEVVDAVGAFLAEALRAPAQ